MSRIPFHIWSGIPHFYTMEFPIYAQHPDGSVWYKILSPKHFLEWKRLGASKHPQADTYIKSEVVAEDYSTALYVQDLLNSIEEGQLLLTRSADLPNF